MAAETDLSRVFARVRTAELRLRAPEPGDAPAILAIHADPETNRFNPNGPMRDAAEAHERLAQWQGEWARDGFGYWTVCDAVGRSVIGFGGIARRVWRDRDVLNMYYRLAPAAWGRGLASAIAREAVRMASEHLPGVPVVVRTRPGNEPAVRTALRAGLQRRADLDDDFLVFVRGWADGQGAARSSGTDA
jgi:ribosomal-protein-alanine N-acetyltransferase